jgi:pimeloyl-ACP methyl ester carboxylesterase
MRARLLLVNSPLVGHETWEPVAADLAADGYAVTVPDLTGILTAGPPYHLRQARVIAGSAAGREVILIGYSRGGSLLAAAGAMLGHKARGYIFVDARLPTPGCSWLQTTSPDLVAHLLGLADPQGWLPPWPYWWAEEELTAILPDPVVRERFVTRCPRLPLAMFEEPDPPAPGWPDAPGAYLQLSEAYDDDAASARDLGWPVRELPSDHLALLTQPGQVAREIRELIGQVMAGR